MFDADLPIVTNEQDRLGRITFAKYLARCILDHKNSESLVLGLYGGWGVGKTSIINLMMQELRYASSNMFDDERPILLNFSPWNYTGHDQIIYHFFRHLSSEIRQADYFEDSKDIIHFLELYDSFFTNRPVPESLRPKHNFLTRLFRRKLITEESKGWESGQDLVQVKTKLNELLINQRHKIIVVIDNINRLEKKEMKQIFQIAKSIGNLSNTVYLLSMDKKIVVETLGTEGTEFLEKIVQLPFEVPPISQQDLELIFIDRLKTLVKEVPEGAWNEPYWADLYYTTIKYLFNTVRDITRYINTVSFSYIHVKDVVNPVDFFAITALEVFEPRVYEGIRENKDLFTDLMDHVFEPDTTKIAEDKLRCDEILERAKKISYDHLLKFLIHLFPRLLKLYEVEIPFYHSEEIARKNLRICSPDVFDIYFRMSMSQGLIPESEFNAILSMVNDEQGFALSLLRLNHDDKIPKFLDLLDTTGVTKIYSEYIGNVINALMDSADLFPEGESTPVSFNTQMRIHRIFHQLLRRFDDTETRFNLFRDAINKATNSIYIIVHELELQSLEHIETEDTFLPLEFRDFSSDQLTELKKLAVNKILSWVQSGRLIEHPKLIPILYGWKSWGDDIECRRYVAEVTKDDKGLIYFLCAALKGPIDESMSKYEKNPAWTSYLETIDDFISPKVLAPHAEKLFAHADFEKLREQEQLAILIFLDLIKDATIKLIPRTSPE